MTIENRVTAVCAFADREQAHYAVSQLKDAGFREGQIGVVTQKQDEIEPAGGSNAAAGAAVGMAAGAGVGALWALGIAAALVPPLGVVAGGTLMAVFASAAAGAAVAGLAGALIGLGIPEDEAKYYENEVQKGNTLVTVKSDGRYEDALSILRQAGGYDMSTRQPGPAATASRGSRRSPIHSI